MPWHVQQGGGSCGSTEWAVIKDSDGSTAGCHKTKSEAEAQMAALYANEPSMNAKQAATRRAATRPGVPQEAARLLPFQGEFRAQLVTEGKHQGLHQLDGYASVVDKPYEMWDFLGPYNEVVSAGAFDETVAANPDVAFLVNHKGMAMARTTNGTLELEADALGLRSRAFLNPQRQDVRDLVTAIDDKNITEMSFAFMIEDGEWSEDFTEYRIKKVNLDRGDVSAVTYGANPYTSIAARSRELLADLDRAPAGLARAALQRLQGRPDLAEQQPSGRSVALELALLRLDES